MSTRLALRALAIALACSPIAIQDCYAARIYNNLGYAIKVDGLGLLSSLTHNYPSVEIGPNQTSGSLQWTNINSVNVSRVSDSVNLCTVGFGAHAQIQGGNYMVVKTYGGPHTYCGVYDSNHVLIAGNS